MGLSKKQKKYLRKQLKRKNLNEVAADLNVGTEEIKQYLKRTLKPEKYQRLLKKTNQPQEKNTLFSKVSTFTLKTFLKKNYFFLIFLSLAVFLVYANSINNEFLSDDIAGILNNKDLDNFSTIFSSPSRALRFFQPLVSFTINAIFGKNPAAFRLVNISFHLGVVLTVFAIIYFLFDQITAFLAACLIAVHPIFIESIVWISGGGYAMYSLFIMLSILFFIFTLKDKRFIYLSVASLFLSLTISEKAVIFLLIMLTFIISYEIKFREWKKLAIVASPALVFALIFLAKVPERIQWLQTEHYQKGKMLNPLIQIPVALSTYLELLFWPKNLTLYQSETRYNQGEFLVRVLILTAFLGLIAYTYKKNRRLFFWLSFFIIALLPALTPFGISWVVAERYVYLGAIGILVAFAIGFKKLINHSKLKPYAFTLFSLIIIALSARTIRRNIDWKNQDNLWLAAAKTSPSSHQNHNNLGDYYGRQGDFEKAIEEFKIAIELNPGYADAYHNLANIYWQMKELDQAIENYQKASELNPKLWQSHQNLAAIYFSQEKLELARQEMEKAIQIDPQNSNLYNNLGNVYLKMGSQPKAKEMFQKAKQILLNFP